jgi:hypothetical protein
MLDRGDDLRPAEDGASFGRPFGAGGKERHEGRDGKQAEPAPAVMQHGNLIAIEQPNVQPGTQAAARSAHGGRRPRPQGHGRGGSRYEAMGGRRSGDGSYKDRSDAPAGCQVRAGST